MLNVNNTPESECYGCEGCSQICPKHCISMTKNDRGFYIPIVDESKCIECKQCIKVCPMRNDIKKNKLLEAYAMVSNNINKDDKSTSGGIFYLLGEETIKRNGVVIGVEWNDELVAAHCIVTTKSELKKIKGSKYVQSRINDIFKKTRDFLIEKKIVLFSGTACQIAGLKLFLKKEYENLICVEVACHGVPSPGLFKKYLNYIEKKENNKIIGFSFRNRDKHLSGEHFMSKISFENGKKKYNYFRDDFYYNPFINGTSLRKSCYKCKFKGKEKNCDILLSDFWGIDIEYPNFPAKYGASAVIVYSEKGNNLINSILKNVVFEKVDAEKIFKHNKSMIEQTNVENVKLYENLSEDDEVFFEKIFVKNNNIQKVKKIIDIYFPAKIKYKLKRIIGKRSSN